MDSALRSSSGVSPSRKWSLCAGLYTFVCGTAAALVLSDVLVLLADAIGLPTEYPMVALASPALVIGAVAWWAVVERRSAYTYLRGGAFGLVTALLTGLLWTVRFVSVWGFEMLATPVIPLLIVLVLGVAVVAGALTGLSLMYARRRLNGRPSGETERPV